MTRVLKGVILVLFVATIIVLIASIIFLVFFGIMSHYHKVNNPALLAFLDYEVGEMSPPLTALIAQHATYEFWELFSLAVTLISFVALGLFAYIGSVTDAFEEY